MKTKKLSLSQFSRLRLSCAALVVLLRDRKGRFALTINNNRRLKGEFVLTPIGGALTVSPSGKEELKNLLGVKDLELENGSDLRLTISGHQVQKFRHWFLKTKEREFCPQRELKEELVEELQLLTEEELETLTYQQVGYYTELAPTTRRGQEGKMTLRIAVIFELQMPAKILKRLEKITAKQDSALRFVSAEEILDGVTSNGDKIGTIARSLLNYVPSLPQFV